MFKSLFSKESLSIFKDRKLLIAITAIIFVPILYAGMFLWAFWDPYDLLEDIPVAIVNEDEGYHFEGEELALGDELVANLTDEPEFDFHFVNKTDGYKGLEKQDYYILIEIPEDFSEHATTIMDDSPEQLELIYVPNESYNFLASQMGETAMLQIEMVLEEKITETYAETIFDKIDEVADQLVDASDATDELNDGAHDLKDGSKTIKGNLNKLAEKTIEFTDGVETAHDGTGDLVDGAATLSSGIDELYDNSEKLYDASEDIQSGANQLADGVTAADDGVSELQKNIPTLIDGTKEVHDGLTTFHTELPKQMSEKVTTTVIEEKNEFRNRMNDSLEEKRDESSKNIANKVASEAKGIVSETNEFIGNVPEELSKRLAKNITQIIKNITKPNLDHAKNDITAILEKESLSEGTIDQVIGKLDESSSGPDYDKIEAQIQAIIQDVLDNALEDIILTEEQLNQLEGRIQEQTESQLKETLNQVIFRVNGAFDDFEEVLLDKLAGITSGLEHEVKRALDEPIGELQSGLTAINKGQSLLLHGVGELADGTNELKRGSQQLVSGQQNYVANMDQFTTSFIAANDGANELSSGTFDLLNGIYELKDGSIQLSDGVFQLADGSDDLYDGMVILVDGTEEFNDKMDEAAGEAGDVNATDDTNSMIANPVEVHNEKINEVPNYGTGFAPYFLSLGLFVGALLLSIVYPLREPSATPTSGTQWFFRKFIVLFGIGVLQAFIASGILLYGLGIEVQSVPLFVMYAVITSLTFITLIQFFVTCFDDPGRFIAIIILILQLTTSAGTFPLELIPKALQPLNTVLPMTYSVAGFKAVVSSGDFSVMWQNAGVLLIFTTIFIVLTWVYFLIKYKEKYASHELDGALAE